MYEFDSVIMNFAKLAFHSFSTKHSHFNKLYVLPDILQHNIFPTKHAKSGRPHKWSSKVTLIVTSCTQLKTSQNLIQKDSLATLTLPIRLPYLSPKRSFRFGGDSLMALRIRRDSDFHGGAWHAKITSLDLVITTWVLTYFCSLLQRQINDQ